MDRFDDPLLTYSLVSFWRRLLAGTIDLLILVPIQLLVGLWGTILFIEPIRSRIGTALALLCTCVAGVVVWIGLMASGRTFGEVAARIEVVTVNGTVPTTRQRILRTCVLLLELLPAGLGLFSVLLSSSRRGFHDRISRTVVLRKWPAGCCRVCGYTLSGLPGRRCPECGAPFESGHTHAG